MMLSGFFNWFYFFALLPPVVVLLCLLEAAFIQANDYSWGGPGRSTEDGDVDQNTENGEFSLKKKKRKISQSVFASYLQAPVVVFVLSVSHRSGVVWLLSDAAADTQDEDVLQRELQRAG